MPIQRVNRKYQKRETVEVANFADALKTNAAPNGTFDSAAAADFSAAAISQGDTGASMPKKLQVVLDEFDGKDEKGLVVKAIFDGISIYEDQHGCNVPADVIEQAIHSAYGTSREAMTKYGTLDSANSLHQDNNALQPNRAILAILSILTEAVPFAHYLPADIGSNKAVLAIASHKAGSAFGQYAEGGLMDGIRSGGAYVTTSRVHKCAVNLSTGAITGALTSIQSDAETCDATNGSTIKLLRGRSLVYVNGQVVAGEISASGTGGSTVSGSVTLSGTTYQIGGTINTDTGVIALTSTPALPSDTLPVHVEGFIDYERDATLTPTIVTAVDTFEIYAKPWRALTSISMDAGTQMSNELGLDPYSEGILAIQSQFANERHYEALYKMIRLGVNNQQTHDFEWDARSAQMNRSQIWQDFASPLGVVSQTMAEATLNHGVTHMYVGKYIAAQLRGLPSSIFQPSGIADRPGIYRLGRLFGAVDVYYTPKGLTDTATTGQVLCVGRATDVTRNPIVMGDAVAPTVIPLNVGSDLKRGTGFYARNFTSVNPHSPSAQGAALINVTNMA